MKKSIKVFHKGKFIDKQISVIPLRYIFAIFITILEIAAIVAIVVALAIYVPYFYLALMITHVCAIIGLVISNDNPDYKIVWLFFVVVLPVIGLMLYFIFSKRTLPKKYIKRYNKIKDSYTYYDEDNLQALTDKNALIQTQAKCLSDIADSHLYKNVDAKYYASGENMQIDIIKELNKAKKFIFLEYFIIEAGEFWNSILDILIKKANSGVEVKVVYDDIGCMNTLPGNYFKQLKEHNIDAVLFSKLKGQANGEFNNRSHRKIMVIDGQVAFTGGVNIADEYINKHNRFGHWKDVGVKIKGKSVNEFTKLFLIDYYVNIKKETEIDFNKYYIAKDETENDGFIVPFGDGPKPIYEHSVGKTAILNLLNNAYKCVYITTPYLVVDNEIMRTLENTAKRGVDIKIIIPHVADKKLIFGVTKTNCQILIKSGVKIYEYTPGFIHSKIYVADNETAIVGTMNLDYRSLTHNFENGVWAYNHKIVKDISLDFLNTLNKCEFINNKKIKNGIFKRIINVFVRLFSPLL